jgi:Asp/Glu/hydantoin racemase
LRVFLLHTVPGLVEPFTRLVADAVPGAEVTHLVDESLLAATIAHGMLPRTRLRVVEHVAYAERCGAGAVLVTCSSIGEAAEAARPFTGIPVYRVDAPMAAEAVRLAAGVTGAGGGARAGDGRGGRIGVVATLGSTLEPTRRLVERAAAEAGVPAEVVASVCEGAFAALKAGDGARHDRLVAGELRRVAGEVDVLVLAQASMSRIVDGLPAGEIGIPVLSSPASGVRQLRA